MGDFLKRRGFLLLVGSVLILGAVRRQQEAQQAQGGGGGWLARLRGDSAAVQQPWNQPQSGFQQPQQPGPQDPAAPGWQPPVPQTGMPEQSGMPQQPEMPQPGQPWQGDPAAVQGQQPQQPWQGAQPAGMPGVQYVGIRRENFDFDYSAQRNSQWCWAASIQMVLAYYGVKVSQEAIVARTFGQGFNGQLPNNPGDARVITANLNTWNVDENGQRYHVVAQFGQGAPPPQLLLQEMAQQHPVILGVVRGPSGGHAMVATAASYTPAAGGATVQSIIVRDPWPSPENQATNGRQEFPAAPLAQSIGNYWIIRVER